MLGISIFPLLNKLANAFANRQKKASISSVDIQRYAIILATGLFPSRVIINQAQCSVKVKTGG